MRGKQTAGNPSVADTVSGRPQEGQERRSQGRKEGRGRQNDRKQVAERKRGHEERERKGREGREGAYLEGETVGRKGEKREKENDDKKECHFLPPTLCFRSTAFT